MSPDGEVSVGVDPAQGAVFIHDFVPVVSPWPDGPGRFAFALTPDLVADLVARAWNEEAAVAAGSGLDLHRCRPADLEVEIGRLRQREDAVVIPLRWRTARIWVAPLDADLEVARFSTNRLHLHLLGRSQLPPEVYPCTSAASLHQRLAVAVVRHVLSQLVEAVSPFGTRTTPEPR